MSRARRGDRQLAMRDRNGSVTEPGSAPAIDLAEFVERFVHDRDIRQRSIVPVRRIFFCSSSTP